jgi:hypothetical protein
MNRGRIYKKGRKQSPASPAAHSHVPSKKVPGLQSTAHRVRNRSRSSMPLSCDIHTLLRDQGHRPPDPVVLTLQSPPSAVQPSSTAPLLDIAFKQLGQRVPRHMVSGRTPVHAVFGGAEKVTGSRVHGAVGQPPMIYRIISRVPGASLPPLMT